MFKVGTSIQAIDGECGIWLNGKVREVGQEETFIYWSGYGNTSWVENQFVRDPIRRRTISAAHIALRALQLGDQFSKTIPGVRGGLSPVFTVETNDPFLCVIRTTIGLDVKYEYISEQSIVKSSTAVVEDVDDVVVEPNETEEHDDGQQARKKRKTLTVQKPILAAETIVLKKNGCRFVYTSQRRFNDEDLEEDEEATQETAVVKEVDIDTAINYIGSEEYLEKYGDKPVFANYRRNFKGGVPPKKTRKMCIRGKDDTLKVSGNPCPLCRDDHLLLHHKNVKLLEQFICPSSLEVYSWYRTSICQVRYKQLVKAVNESRSIGLMPSPRPVFVKYNYEDYFTKENRNQKEGLSSS